VGDAPLCGDVFNPPPGKNQAPNIRHSSLPLGHLIPNASMRAIPIPNREVTALLGKLKGSSPWALRNHQNTEFWNAGPPLFGRVRGFRSGRRIDRPRTVSYNRLQPDCPLAPATLPLLPMQCVDEIEPAGNTPWGVPTGGGRRGTFPGGAMRLGATQPISSPIPESEIL
jgi:hypothetical protein